MTVAIVIFVLSCVVAYLLRLVFSMFAAADTRGVHWRFNRLKGARWIYYDVDDCVVPAEHGYPVLFHWLLAQLPRSWWIPGGFLINAALDLIVAAALFCLVGITIQNASESAWMVAALIGIVFLFTPALVPVNARMMAFNGRAFGFMLASAYALCLYLGAAVGQSWAFVGAGVLFVLIVLSSQFSFQAAMVMTIGVAIGLTSIGALVTPLIAVALSWLVRPIGVRSPLRYYLGLYRWQFRERKSNTMPAARARWLSDAWRQLRARRFNPLIRTIFYNSPQIISIISAPALLVMLWLVIARWSEFRALLDQPLLHFSWIMLISLGAATVLTSFQPFSIFGQAERYLEYAAPAVAILAIACFESATLFASASILIAVSIALCLLNVLICAMNKKLLFGGEATYLSNERFAFIDWLDELPENARILPVPISRGKTIAAANRAHRTSPIRVLYDWLSLRDEPPLSYMNRCLVGLRYSPESFRHALKEFDFDAALIFKNETVVWIDDRGERDWRLLLGELDDAWSVAVEDASFALLVNTKQESGRIDAPAQEHPRSAHAHASIQP